MDRDRIAQSRRWVVKIGSALLTNDGQGLAYEAIADWVKQLADLRKRGYDIILVSSGAVAAGMHRLGWSTRPKAVNELQAAAAVGQTSLVRAYEQAFEKYNLKSAQVLLDHDDLSNRERYLNARSTIKTLCGIGVIPIVNENDTVVTDEIRFGDNDTLGALVANLIEADVLCILTDQDAMYDGDPRQNALARKLIAKPANAPELDRMAGGGGSLLGTGGMSSKVRAARYAARSGADTIIVGGRIDEAISKVAMGEQIGTLLYAEHAPLAARKRWLDGNLQPKGTLVVDDGAVSVLLNQGKSLLPVGVEAVKGDFNRGDLVECLDRQGRKIASGLVNYNSDEAHKIAGVASSDIAQRLGYKDSDELIHRDNLVVKSA